MEPKLTRQGLYDLVWSKPITHIAKEYGVSDVAVRKHCVKHDIPTPPVGYWMKVAYGKAVRKPALPVKKRAADEAVMLTPRDPAIPLSAEVLLAVRASEAEREQLAGELRVPDLLPDKPHWLVRAIRAGLRRAKVDGMGYIRIDEKDLPKLEIGKSSTDRVLRLIQGFVTTAEERGHQFVRSEEGFDWLVGGERFALHLYEVREKKPHEPTRKELFEQAQHDERSRRSPTVYSKDHKVYRVWDYFPSGRLTIEVRDQYGRDWQFGKVSARWRDTSRTALEGRLVDLFIWLDQGSVMAREKRLAIEDRDRREKEAEERMRRARIRREAAERVEKVLKTLSDTVHELRRTQELIAYLETRPRAADSPAGRLLVEARGYADVLQGRLEEQAITDLLKAEHVEFTDELLTPALAGPPLPRWYGGY